MRVVLHLLFVTFLSLSATAQADDPRAMQILEKMTSAAKTLTYEGVFNYQSGRNLQSIRIFHRSDESGELERMISLNGAAREVIRSNDMVTCINPEGKQVNVSRRPLGRGFPSDLPRRFSSAAPYYEVEMGAKNRVAGKDAYQLLITPIDNYRYGYRLWVDVDTYLLLKSELIAQDGDVLETFSFSSVSTGEPIPDYKFKSLLADDDMVWHKTEPQEPLDIEEHDHELAWQVNWLPDGFALVALQNRLRANNGADVEQRVYSDGLSSVSVFIEKIRAKHNHLHGASHVGGINAFGMIMNAHFVTVVGEVPAVTVEKIGGAIAFTQAEQE
jgi:sigma-E factor negative regulatory protein RseB